MKQLLQFALLGLVLLLGRAQASEALVSIIIDDLGNNAAHGEQAIQLPGVLTYALLPNTHFATVLAELAHEKVREVILHLPMDSDHHDKHGPN